MNMARTWLTSFVVIGAVGLIHCGSDSQDPTTFAATGGGGTSSDASTKEGGSGGTSTGGSAGASSAGSSTGGSATGGSGQGGSAGTAGATVGGSGGDGGAAGSGGSGCVETNPATCPETFDLPNDNYFSAELRADFNNNFGTAMPMTKSTDGSMWQVEVQVPSGVAVQYKFVIKRTETSGEEWVLNPSDPTVQNGQYTNNLASAITCGTTCSDGGVGGAGGGGGTGGSGGGPGEVFDWRSAAIYYLFVDRFHDGNPNNNCPYGGATAPIADFNGGDWVGVTQKIRDDYFKNLGVNVLMISSPVDTITYAEWGRNDGKQYTAYHGYWPSNFDPQTPFHCLGTKDELKEMITEAHNAGMQVMFDLVLMHTHSSSPAFTQHNDWFWTNNGGPIYYCDENNGGNWNTWNGDDWDGSAPGTRCWFTNYLPHWNFTNAAARDFFVNNTIAWVNEYNVDGFRMDAVKHVDISMLEQLRAALTTQVLPNRKPGTRFFLDGENFEYWRPHLRWHVNPSTRLDGNYEFVTQASIINTILKRSGTMYDLRGSIDESDGFYHPDAIMTPFFGSQDMPRAIHKAEDQPWEPGKWADPPPTAPTSNNPYERLAVAFTVMFTNKGAPLIYYGDELGAPGADDPDNRRKMLWDGILPQQQGLRDKVSTLLRVRSEHRALWAGTRQTIDIQNDLWVYSKTDGSDVVYVAINRSDYAQTTTQLPSVGLTDLLSGQSMVGPNDTIPARTARIYIAQ